MGLTNADSKPETSTLTRRLVPNVDWMRCIYCQKRKKNEEAHQVQCKNTIDAIHKHASHYYQMKCRTGKNYLFANKAHYNRTCRRDATGAITSEAPNVSIRVNTDEQQNSPFQTLTDMLHMGFINGCVHTMDHITSTYSSLLNKTGMDSNMRMPNLKNKLIALF